MNMTLQDTANSNQIVAGLNGDFDSLNIIQVREELEQTIMNSTADNVVLDLSNVDFIDSSGIGAIVFLYKRLHGSQRHLELIGAKGQPKQLLQLLRISQAIPVTWAAE